MWNGGQKNQYDLGQHSVEYKEQNEVADESIAMSAPSTYAVAVCCEHHTVRGGPYLKLTQGRRIN